MLVAVVAYVQASIEAAVVASGFVVAVACVSRVCVCMGVRVCFHVIVLVSALASHVLHVLANAIMFAIVLANVFVSMAPRVCWCFEFRSSLLLLSSVVCVLP